MERQSQLSKGDKEPNTPSLLLVTSLIGLWKQIAHNPELLTFAENITFSVYVYSY